MHMLEGSILQDLVKATWGQILANSVADGTVALTAMPLRPMEGRRPHQTTREKHARTTPKVLGKTLEARKTPEGSNVHA